MSTGPGRLLKVTALGVGVMASVTGWNTVSDTPVPTRDTMVQLSALIGSDPSLASGEAGEEADQPIYQTAFVGMQEAVSTVGTALRNAVASDDEPPAVVNRSSSSSRTGGGAKFVSNR